MKIAWFSPLNPVPSGISDYTEELLDELARHVDLELFTDGSYRPANPEIGRRFPVHAYDESRFDPGSYDAVVYHMGNNYAAHGYIHRALLRFPGIVVLHDYVLQGFYAEMLQASRDRQGYRELLQRRYPDQAEALARTVMEGLPGPIWESERALDFPLCEETVGAARALIVHSRFVGDRLAGAGKPVAVIPHHGHRRRSFDAVRTRRQLGISPHEILICSTGFVTPNKRYETVAAALRELGRDDLHYLIAGRDDCGFARRRPPRDPLRLTVTGFLPLAELEACIEAADLCVNLRYPTMGESSGSLLRMMGYGKPVLVTRAGSYAELPDHAAIKIDAGVDEREALRRYLAALIADADFRTSLGREARAYVDEECSLERCARLYAEFICAQAGR